MQKLRLTILMIVLLFSIGCQKGADAPEFSGKTGYNLLLIVIDTMRADRIGAYGCKNAGTPNIDRLARDGVMFENCYAQVPLTLPSHCTLFTGRFPFAHNVRNNGSYYLNEKEITLAEIMKEQGLLTYAVIGSFVLHSRFGLAQGFGFYDDSLNIKELINDVKTEIRADRVYAGFKSRFDKEFSKRFFAWIHFYDPHKPYDPPGNYKTRFPGDPYQGEVSFVDFHIGKIVADLKAKEILDKTSIIIVGDHGEAFGEHKEFGHGIFCYEESLKVPLIFYNPGILGKGRVITRPVGLVDFLPTVLHLFGIKKPAVVQGKSFAALMSGHEAEKEQTAVYFESMQGKEKMNFAPLTGLLVDNYKYISLPEPELYDLKNDPLEKTNLFLKKNTLAKKMDRQLKEYMISHSTAAFSTKRKLTGEEEKRLRSLGYISPVSAKAKQVIDPKKGIIIVNKMNDFEMRMKEKKYDEAEKVLKGLIAEHPDFRSIRFYSELINLYVAKKDVKQRTKTLLEAIGRFPEETDFKMNLALLYLKAGDMANSEKWCLKLLKQDPSHTPAYIILARIKGLQALPDRAVSYYEKALAIEPLNVLLQFEYIEYLFSIGKRDRMIEVADSVLKNETFNNETDNHKIKTRIAILLSRVGEIDRGIAVLREIIAEKKADAHVWHELGMSYSVKGDFKNAFNAFNRSLALDSNNAKICSSMGNLLMTLYARTRDKRYLVKTIEYFTRAVKIDPQFAEAHTGLGSAYRFAGEKEKAIKAWQAAIRVNPGVINAYLALGTFYLETGQKQNARKILNRCKELFYSKLKEPGRRRLDQLLQQAK